LTGSVMLKRIFAFCSLSILFMLVYSSFSAFSIPVTKLSIGEFSTPPIVYANRDFLLNATVTDLDGVANLMNATVELNGGIILFWDNRTGIFSELRDPNNYCLVDSNGSFRVQLNSTAYKLCWKLRLNWAYPEMLVSVLPANTRVFDGKGRSASGGHADLFAFEDDIRVANAFVSNPIISIDFDDGWSSVYELALPVLASKNIPARVNIATSNVGLDGFMTWSQIKELQDVYGWEIGSHSVSHPDLTKLNSAELEYELSQSKLDLEAHGLNVTSFAVPYSSYNNMVLSKIAKYYRYARIDAGENVYPYFRDLQALFFNVANDTSFDAVKAEIDKAIEEGRWLILLFHIIAEENPDMDTKYRLSDFERIVNYIDAKREEITPLPFSSALDTLLSSNLVPNPSFEEWTKGWADYWERTHEDHISIDVESKGVKPSEKQSLKIVAGSSDYWAYSSPIPVSPETTYLFKCYVNLQDFYSGMLSFQIEEYDSKGEWLSTYWLFGKFADYVGYEVELYTPSSSEVDHVQVYIGSVGSGSFTAYIDQVTLAKLEPRRINPSRTISIKGRVYYEGTRIPPGDPSGVIVKVNLEGVGKGSTSSLDPEGGFRVLLTSEGSPSLYNYRVSVSTDETSELEQRVAVIVDRVLVADITSNSSTVDIGSAVQINVTLQYESDGMPVTSGSFLLNGLRLTHKGGGIWQCIDRKDNAQTVIYDRVEGTYGLYGLSDINMNEKALKVVWSSSPDKAILAQDALILVILSAIGLVAILLLRFRFRRSGSSGET